MIWWLIILLIVFELFLLLIIAGVVMAFPALPDPSASGVSVIDILKKLVLSCCLIFSFFYNVGEKICMTVWCVWTRIELDNAPFVYVIFRHQTMILPQRVIIPKIMSFIEILIHQLQKLTWKKKRLFNFSCTYWKYTVK